MLTSLKNDYRDGQFYLNPIFLMVDSGSRVASPRSASSPACGA